MRFKASFGITVWLTTSFMTLILAGVIFLIVKSAFGIGSPVASKITGGIVVFLIAGGYLWMYLLRPLRYIVSDDHIVVDRLIKKVVIDKHQIKDAFIIRRESLDSLQKVGGNAGLFGFTGEFNTPFGRTILYATRFDKLIMIQTFRDGNIIVTPDDTSMIRAVKGLLQTA